MSTATQATDLLAAWERYNASLEALIESADGEYQEQRRFSAFRAGWRDGGNASVDATLRDTLVLAAGKRIDDLERALAAATARAEASELKERVRDAIDCLSRVLDDSRPFTLSQREEVGLAIDSLRAALAAAAPGDGGEGV